MRRIPGIILISLLTCMTSARAQFVEQRQWAGTSGGTANAMVLTLPNVSTMADLLGVHVNFKVGTTNTGATTATVNGLPAVPVMKITTGGLAPLIGGELTAGPPPAVVSTIFDGTEFVISSPTFPPVITAPVTYFVSNSGSDSNNCLSLVTSCATVQHVLALVQSFNINGFTVTINLANGVYAPFSLVPLNGSGAVVIIGNNVTPSLVVISASSGEAIIGNGVFGYTLSGMKVSSAANGSAPHQGDGIRIANGQVSIYDMEFGACANAQVHADVLGNISMLGTLFGASGSNFINISGSATAALESSGGTIYVGGVILNVASGTFTYSLAFATAFSGGVINQTFSTINLTGSVAGLSYFAFFNGIINTSGGGANYFPHSSPGTTQSGGQYGP